MPEHFTDGVDAILVPVERADLLASAIRSLAGDAGLRGVWPPHRAPTATFDARRAVARIEAVYREVLAQ
ncbi:MAG: hypothetical protein WKF43_00190 [Acidimicrobiales bacterium]